MLFFIICGNKLNIWVFDNKTFEEMAFACVKSSRTFFHNILPFYKLLVSRANQGHLGRKIGFNVS